MPTLKAPNKIVFLVSLILVIVAWASFLAGIPRIGEHPSILIILAFVVLAFGCAPLPRNMRILQITVMTLKKKQAEIGENDSAHVEM